MKGAICAIFLAVCLTRAVAFDCYQCNDCALSGVFSIFESKTTCPAISGIGGYRCVKEVAADGKVNRRCGSAVECTFSAITVQCKDPSDTFCTICCDTEVCNSALNMKAPWFAIGLALAAAILILRN